MPKRVSVEEKEKAAKRFLAGKDSVQDREPFAKSAVIK